MYACAENPKTSHCAMVLMQDPVLGQESSRLLKMDSSRFVDVNIVKMKPESVTEHTARCDREKFVWR